MSLIDIRKLNAEVDALIAKQDDEVKKMKEKRESTLDELHMWMLTDLAEMAAIAKELIGSARYPMSSFDVMTDIFSQYLSDPLTHMNQRYVIRFEDCSSKVAVCLERGSYCGRIDVNDSRGWNKRNLSNMSAGLNADLDHIVQMWRDQFPAFKKRFEEACVNYIKRKAELANERYAKAEREVIK